MQFPFRYYTRKGSAAKSSSLKVTITRDRAGSPRIAEPQSESLQQRVSQSVVPADSRSAPHLTAIRSPAAPRKKNYKTKPILFRCTRMPAAGVLDRPQIT
jgi:hypothetical protein